MMKPDTPKFATIPQSALDWLFGNGPDDDGFHFHETMDIYRKTNIGALPAYWWRSHFSKLISAAPKPYNSVQDAEPYPHPSDESKVEADRIGRTTGSNPVTEASIKPKPDCVGVEEMRFMCITAYRDYLNNGNEPKVCAAVFLIDYLASRGLLAVKEKAQENTPERINKVYTAERMDGPCYFVNEETKGGRS